MMKVAVAIIGETTPHFRAALLADIASLVRGLVKLENLCSSIAHRGFGNWPARMETATDRKRGRERPPWRQGNGSRSGEC